MSRILGVRQQRVQFFYDTDFLTVGLVTSGTDLCASEKHLFASATPGSPVRTNMPAAGFLTGDQTFMCFAVRHEITFWGGNSSAAAAHPQDLETTAGVSIWCINLSTFSFQVGEKVEFEGPCGMTPAGGGPWGVINDSNQPLIANGEPQTKAIYVLPLPIAITKRQGIRVTEKKTDLTNPNGNPGAIPIISMVNNYLGGKLFRCYLDGFNTRDVQ